MTVPSRRLLRPCGDAADFATREWIVTNGLGGYASGTLCGVLTRRYHGLLIAALPAPLGRTVMLSQVVCEIRMPEGHWLQIDPVPPLSHADHADDRTELVEFRLDAGLPVWRYRVRNALLEKRVLMPHWQNTVHIAYSIRGTGHATLRAKPLLHPRHYSTAPALLRLSECALTAAAGRFEIHCGEACPPLHVMWHGAQAELALDANRIEQGYEEDRARGYEADGNLWSPGHFQVELDAANAATATATLVASTEPWDVLEAGTPAKDLDDERARRDTLIVQAGCDPQSFAAELVLAADQFVIVPAERPRDMARQAEKGTEARTIVAGYHWFTDWGRDTMIGLDGLTLVTGRTASAAAILRTFSTYVREGLIPNMFPDGDVAGLYHTADASLWFFHAVDRYLTTTGDLTLRRELLPVLRHIVECHLRGTNFGISVDPADGLLKQGAPGYQLTWMDAKVDDWVVTPRRGKAVEINALLYNALRLLESWIAEDTGAEAAREYGAHAERLRRSFNARFWYSDGGYLYDVVDGEGGDDPSCRPNQILSFSLRHAVLDPQHWRAVFDVVRTRLLTPYGLRSLAPGERNYKSKYYGDLRARDAAYHQGTVWAWLIGPFVDAWLRIAPDAHAEIAGSLRAFEDHLNEAGVGSISEIFDAEPPYTPRGCIAQAWSVAEVLRAWTMVHAERRARDVRESASLARP
jgi:predicted glycogen debranching enzyme